MEKKCKHCASMIPREAKICPHCRKRQGMSPIVKIFLVFFALMVIPPFCTGFNKGINKNQPPDASLAYVMSQDFVKRKLVAPATADFASFSDVCVKMTGSNPAEHWDAVFAVASYVDSQNVFGAKVRTYYTCHLRHIQGTDNWQCYDLDLNGGDYRQIWCGGN